MSWDHLSMTLPGWSGGQVRDHSEGSKRVLWFKTVCFHPHTLRCFHISPSALPCSRSEAGTSTAPAPALPPESPWGDNGQGSAVA